MKPEQKMRMAFVLNLAFSILEWAGGLLTGSVAILSDALHDLGDAASIGIACLLERKSRRPADARYTYGYWRYSVMGSMLVTLILLVGSGVVMYQAVQRIFRPIVPNYDGMILFAVIGVLVNGLAAVLTREKGSLNQRAINLHMLEDLLGWLVVLLGAIVMRFTGFALLDPILSIGVAAFILVQAVRNWSESIGVFLEKAPVGMDAAEIGRHLAAIDGVQALHHLHVWSLDGVHHCATMHLVTDCEPQKIKAAIREALREHGVGHVTIELESPEECCNETDCRFELRAGSGHIHAHGHAHGHG